MIQRTTASGLLALAIPAALWLWWPLVLPLVALIVYQRALTGWVAGAIGAGVMVPKLLLAFPVLLLVGLYLRHQFPPGAITDTVRGRLVSWLYLLKTWHWQGSGVDGPHLALEEAYIMTDGLSMPGGPPHNMWMFLAHRWGVLGVGLVGTLLVILAALIRPHSVLGATLAVAAVLVSIGSPIDEFVRWIRGGRDGELWTQRHIRLSIRLYVDDLGRTHLFQSKRLTREQKILGAKMLIALAQNTINAENITEAEFHAAGLPVPTQVA
jgi:hypothetical protein